MSYMMVVGACVSCRAFITFHPDFVPSIRVEGEREPLCRACFTRWNEIHRVSKGLEPLSLHSQAYVGDPNDES